MKTRSMLQRKGRIRGTSKRGGLAGTDAGEEDWLERMQGRRIGWNGCRIANRWRYQEREMMVDVTRMK